VEYPHKLLSSTVYIPQFLCRFESLSIILTHITNGLSLVHEVWEIGWCIEIGRGIHQTTKLDKAGSTPYRIVWGGLTTLMARTYSCPNLGICQGLHLHENSLWVAFPGCYVSFMWYCLAVNNLNIQLQCLVTMAQMNTYRILDVSTHSQPSITSGEHKAQGRIWLVWNPSASTAASKAHRHYLVVACHNQTIDFCTQSKLARLEWFTCMD